MERVATHIDALAGWRMQQRECYACSDIPGECKRRERGCAQDEAAQPAALSADAGQADGIGGDVGQFSLHCFEPHGAARLGAASTDTSYHCQDKMLTMERQQLTGHANRLRPAV